MLAVYLVLLVLACVLFGLAAFGRNNASFNAVAAGLLCFALVPMLQTLVKLV